MDKTKVIFRKYKDGDVIAIFPEELGASSAFTCSSYQSTGQHGAADPMLVIETTKPASTEESQPLQKELESIGYELKVIKRNRYEFYQTRKLLLKSYYG